MSLSLRSFAVCAVALASLSAQGQSVPATSTSANPSTIETIRATLGSKLSPGTQIDAIRPSAMPGLFEVQIGTDVVFVNENATFLFQGALVNLNTGRNITQERKEAIVAEMEAKVMPSLWSDASLNDALKLVRGKGTRKVVVFEDPYCGFCKKIRQTFAEMDDITIYTFLVTGLTANSPTMARNIWCAPNRLKAYDDWMLRNVAPGGAAQSCSDPIQRVATLAKSLGVGPVPHVVFADGSKNLGYMPSADMNKKLTSVTARY